MRNKNNKVVKTFFAMIVLTAIVLAGFSLILNRNVGKQDDEMPTSEKQILMTKDDEMSYPGTPREVVKLFCRYNMFLYNETLSDKEFSEMLDKMRVLFESEFIANNAKDKQLEQFQAEVKSYRNVKRSIVSYTLDKSSETVYKTVDDKEYATLSGAYLLRNNDGYVKLYYKFMLRKENEKWKILGFDKVESTETGEQ